MLTLILFVSTYVLNIRWSRYDGCFWWDKKVQICYVVNRNEGFLVIFCINFVPWWCKHTIFLGYTNYPYMNLDYKNPLTLLDMTTTLSLCILTYSWCYSYFVCTRHAPSILFTIRTYSGRSGRVWPNTRRVHNVITCVENKLCKQTSWISNNDLRGHFSKVIAVHIQ